MFIVDAFIGNRDRHDGNRGFLYDTNTDEVTLAPVYDCDSIENEQKNGFKHLQKENPKCLHIGFSVGRHNGEYEEPCEARVSRTDL